jgi:formylglycine-generating enzyme required for sulfatase activity
MKGGFARKGLMMKSWLKSAWAVLAGAAVMGAAAAWGGGGTGPKIGSFAVDTAAGGCSLRFPAEADTVYELQRASVLAPEADWSTVDTRLAEANGTLELTDDVPAGRTRSFYRIAEGAGTVPGKAGGYLVVDMSGGRWVANWPVTETDLVPYGGWTDEYKTTKLLLRRLPAGTYAMGSPDNEGGRSDDENRHLVKIGRDFYMGVFEVTQKQWQLAMGTSPSTYAGDTRPVESVSYENIRGGEAGAEWPVGGGHAVDAASFLGVLRQKTGLDFDLPTEAQWEYACRAGTTNALNSGKDLTFSGIFSGSCPNVAKLGRYKHNASDGTGGYTNQTTKAGSYAPNAWGLYDMHGNVFEWCLDWYGAYPSGAATDPAGADAGASRVLRGGAWSSDAKSCRSAYRHVAPPSNRLDSAGFRVACPAEYRYLVVDMNGGKDAASWPVSELADVPAGGWTDEYKTGKLVLRRIPAGTFTMGSPEDELGRDDDETQHEVTISKPFYMGVFEVTQKQWELATGKTPSEHKGDVRPVEFVSYNAIRGAEQGAGWPQDNAVDDGSFLAVLRAKTGLTFDLPTEAQWEYACRAGTTTALNSGKNLTHTIVCTNMAEVGRYGYNLDDGKGGYAEHTKVGSYRPNAWGLYDMHGNALELCLDWFGAYDAGAATDPAGPASGQESRARVARGGGWDDYPDRCRSASRRFRGRLFSDWTLGFRLSAPAP